MPSKDPDFRQDANCLQARAFGIFLILLDKHFIALSEEGKQELIEHVNSISQFSYCESQYANQLDLQDQGLWVAAPKHDEEDNLK